MLSGLEQLQPDARENRRLQQLDQPVNLRTPVLGLSGRAVNLHAYVNMAFFVGIAMSGPRHEQPRIHDRSAD